jgi:hypothetical protein
MKAANPSSLSILAGTAFLLLQLGVAQAGSIFTPIIFLGAGNQIVCVANNVSAETIRVTVRIVGLTNGGVSTETCTLAAGDFAGCQIFRNDDGGHCQIIVANTEQDHARAVVRGVLFSRRITAPFTTDAIVQAQ